MSQNGRHVEPAQDHRRRRALIVGLIVLALIVFGAGYVFGSGRGDEVAAPASPSSTLTSPGPSPSATPSRSRTPSSSPSVSPTQDPSGDALGDGRYFVRLTDLQGGEEGPLLLRYDLAYFYTGDAANQVAASRGDETPVPNDVYIVDDNHKLRFAPLDETFTVRYLPEGTGLTDPVKSPQDRFLAWLGQTAQTDFPPKETSWWWITIADGSVTKIEQQYLP